jgi:NAD(P)-dependent dehydrogenase (short-subunit alcohol dehydrogenase family)
MKKLLGKVAVVTGGARGLGRASAHRLADLGADVALLDIDMKAAARYDEQLSASTVSGELIAKGVRSLELEVDLTRKSSTDEAFARIKKELGRIDILVNVAGGLTTSGNGNAAEIPPEDVRTNLDINLMTTVHCCQAVTPVMRSLNGGVIVNVSSAAGLWTYPAGKYAGYATAKAAVNHYTRHLAAELGPENIRVNGIAPGLILTSRVAALSAARGIGGEAELQYIPLRRHGTLEDFAGVLEFLVTDMSSYVTGECIAACGGSLLNGGPRVRAEQQ